MIKTRYETSQLTVFNLRNSCFHFQVAFVHGREVSDGLQGRANRPLSEHGWTFGYSLEESMTCSMVNNVGDRPISVEEAGQIIEKASKSQMELGSKWSVVFMLMLLRFRRPLTWF